MWAEAVFAYFDRFSRHFPGRTEEIHEKRVRTARFGVEICSECDAENGSIHPGLFRLTTLVLDHHLRIIRLLRCSLVHVFHLSYNQVR